MSNPLVSIIMRSFNEGWALRQTLPALLAQHYTPWELIVIDSGSTDGSVQLIERARPRHFVQIRSEDYNPSRVLNHGMRLARSDFGIFLNADATPQGRDWLGPLVQALQNPRTAAVYGRQIPRPECQAVFAHDYDRCFGEKRETGKWEHFFSMVSSGLRKDVWGQRGFLESMQYSEDDEYTRWCRSQGYGVAYCPESVVMHSHNYAREQAYKRSFGEARALAAVWNGKRSDVNWPRTVLLGWLNDLRRDAAFCFRTRRLRELRHAAVIRWQQRRGKLAGFDAGWEFYRNNADHTPAHLHAPATPVLETGPRPMNTTRFTIDGDEALERRLSELCVRVAAEVQSIVPSEKLQALVLGGGYGRGEGGVLKSVEGELPYNDLEFYVFARGHSLMNARRYNPALAELTERISPSAGLHVEFKIDGLQKLRQSGVSMFSYDLVSAHRVITGGSNVFDQCRHHEDATMIPAIEATRLLFNRCTGLLLAREILAKKRLGDQDADFVQRNIAKAKLALGDAVLTVLGHYHWSCRERERRLQLGGFDKTIPGFERIREFHREGVAFKLHPRRSVPLMEQLAAEHQETADAAAKLWLWLESRRLNRGFTSVQEYVFAPGGKCHPQNPGRNLLLNLRTFGMKSLLDPNAWRYPRERLFNTLPVLLWSGDAAIKPELTRHCQRQLQTDASDWTGLVSAYKQVWPSYG